MRSRCFTLIELLAVMSIIAILSGLVVGVSGYASRKAAVAKTIGQLQSMEMALQQYLSDQGHYPVKTTAGAVNWTRGQFSNDQGLCYLSNFPTPYRDAWHQDFFYQCPGIVNTESYDLWSRGPDKKHGNAGSSVTDAQVRGDETSDDVNNWRRN